MLKERVNFKDPSRIAKNEETREDQSDTEDLVHENNGSHNESISTDFEYDTDNTYAENETTQDIETEQKSNVFDALIFLRAVTTRNGRTIKVTRKEN